MVLWISRQSVEDSNFKTMLKEEQLLEKRLIELSRTAYHREIITYTDFLNLNELNILHTLPKDRLFSRFITFGGYESAERQMAAFLPDALSLRTGNETNTRSDIKDIFENELSVLEIKPLHEKYAEDLTHRDYLGAILNLGIERNKTGDILIIDKNAYLFVRPQLASFLCEELTRVRHTSVIISEVKGSEFTYEHKY